MSQSHNTITRLHANPTPSNEDITMVKLTVKKIKAFLMVRKDGSIGHASFSKATCQQKPVKKLERNDPRWEKGWGRPTQVQGNSFSEVRRQVWQISQK